MIRAREQPKAAAKADTEAPKRDADDNYCYKVITQDRHDEIVEVQASLMVGIAKEVCD